MDEEVVGDFTVGRGGGSMKTKQKQNEMKTKQKQKQKNKTKKQNNNNKNKNKKKQKNKKKKQTDDNTVIPPTFSSPPSHPPYAPLDEEHNEQKINLPLQGHW